MLNPTAQGGFLRLVPDRDDFKEIKTTMKRFHLVVLLLVSGLLLAACGGGPAATPTSAPTQAAAAPTVATAAGTTAATAAPASGGTAAATDRSIQPSNPKPTSTERPPKATEPADGGGVITGQDGTAVAVTPANVNPPPTLDDLLKQYPDLKAFIDKLPANLTEGDLAELYKRIVQIFKDKGASGVAVFLKDSRTSGASRLLNLQVSAFRQSSCGFRVKTQMGWLRARISHEGQPDEPRFLPPPNSI